MVQGILDEAGDRRCPQCNVVKDVKPKRKVPKIWFGTRTHKQIGQIAKELGRTGYKHAKMTILSSREHTCVHPKISKLPNKNDECKSLRDGPGCMFSERVKKIASHKACEAHGLKQAWQLEEFVTFCKAHRACAFYGARELRTEANIIFCPYNYLVDPHIRESMDISLKGEIVILDEGHNIEDACREAASVTIAQRLITDGVEDLQILIEKRVKPEEHSDLQKLLQGFSTMVSRHEGELVSNEASRVWSGKEMIDILREAGIEHQNIDVYRIALQKITADDTDEENNREGELNIKAHSNTTATIGSLLMVSEFITMNDYKYADDYRLAITKTSQFVNRAPTPKNGWMAAKRKQNMQLETVFSINFWCLNPAVAFNMMGQDARSVILTSGTLSPMTSFQSELGSSFPIQLEANHVITSKQVWVGSIAIGPRGGSLLGSFQNSETFRYQDEVGELVLHVCQIVPKGVLCFFSSYKSMQKLTERWKVTGTWDSLLGLKQVFLENRGSDKENFDTTMKEFYEAINDPESNGAVMFAIFRGKVSEGMDFSDDNARAVITVGIPYPNFKDVQVGLKQKYNDGLCSKKGLLPGREWYEIQAYRALNQALGRCIRHRGDWGALILVDERYSKNPTKYTKGLSKWVRSKIQCHSNYNTAKDSLVNFVHNMADWQPPPADASVLSSQSQRANISTAANPLNVSLAQNTSETDGGFFRKPVVVQDEVMKASKLLSGLTETTPKKCLESPVLSMAIPGTCGHALSTDVAVEDEGPSQVPSMSTQMPGSVAPTFSPDLSQISCKNTDKQDTPEPSYRKPLFKPKEVSPAPNIEPRAPSATVETPTPKKENSDDEDFVVLNTRRAKRGKRRNSHNSSLRRKSKSRCIQYENASDDDQSKPLRMACPLCKKEIAVSNETVKETYEPFFWKQLKSSSYSSCQAVTIDRKDCADSLSIMKLRNSGLSMNALYEDGVLLQYLQCTQCISNPSAPPIGIEVLMVNGNHKRLKVNQVWLKPECLDT